MRSLIEAIRARPGEGIVGGEYEGGALYEWPHPVRVTGARVQGALKFQDCSGAIELSKFHLRGSPGAGVFLVGNRRVLLRAGEIEDCAGSGVLTAGQSDVDICQCVIRVLGHAIYFSESGKRLRAADNELSSKRRCGIQANGRPERLEDLALTGNQFARCGNVEIQLASCTDVLLEGNRADDPLGPMRLNVWSDGIKRKAKFACQGVSVRGADQFTRIWVDAYSRVEVVPH